VFCRVKMFCSVSIWRLIATTEMAIAVSFGLQYWPPNRFWLSTKNAGRVARFCQVAPRAPEQHRDALAFPDGNAVLVNLLPEGQHARVIQLPVIKQEHGVGAEKASTIAAELEVTP
jgi:hypothetical protein